MPANALVWSVQRNMVSSITFRWAQLTISKYLQLSFLWRQPHSLSVGLAARHMSILSLYPALISDTGFASGDAGYLWSPFCISTLVDLRFALPEGRPSCIMEE